MAIEEFARRGYAGASTEVMAQRVGITQPYIFRLFGTKRELFLAALDAVCTHIRQVFTAAVRSAGEDRLGAMGRAYAGLCSSRHELLLLFQAISASGDEELRPEVRRRYWTLFGEVQVLAGASELEMRGFFADGLLLTAATLLELPELVSREHL